MSKTIKINGTDFTSYFTQIGYKVTYEDIPGDNGGIMLDGSTLVDVLATKASLELPCMPLDEAQLAALLVNLYSVDYPVVYYFDPKSNTYVTKTFYRKGSVTQSYKGEGGTGTSYWTGTSLVLAEK